MATIQTALAMQDAMSPVLEGLIISMERTLNVMEKLDQSSTNLMANVNISGIQALTSNLESTSKACENVQETQQAVEDLGEASEVTAKEISKIENNMKMLNASAFLDIAKTVWDVSKGAIGYLDNLTSIQSRLSLIASENESVASLQNKIKQAADDSRAIYDTMANSVYQLRQLAGDAFQTNDEAIDFLTKLNKQFVVAGTESTAASAAMYQLNQALASGRLQGDEFRSVAENAPMLAQAIADVMGVSKAELKEMSSQGVITADIIKQAVQQSADEVDEMMRSMPMTFSDVVARIQNDAAIAFSNVSQKFSQMINSEDVDKISAVISGGIQIGAMLATVAIDILSGAIGFLSDTMEITLPLIVGLTSAFIAYKTAVGLSTIATGIHAAIVWATSMKEKIWAASVWLASDATFAQTAAQWGLNAALLACPLTWIVLAILALVVLLYMAIGAMNAMGDTSISATGVICGAFMTALAFIGNIFVALYNFIIDLFVALWNFIAAFANFFGNVFNDPIGSIARLFFDLVDTVLELLQSLASAIDTIFGSDLASSVQGWRDGLSGWVDETFGKGEEIMEQLDPNDMHLGRFEYGDAYANGYQFGEGIDNKLGNMFNMNDLTSQMEELESSLNPDSYGMENADVGNVDSVDTVGSIDGEVSLSDEDVKMLKDVATRKYINKFTTLKPNMSVTFGDVHETADTDAIMNAIADMTEQALAETILEEGV